MIANGYRISLCGDHWLCDDCTTQNILKTIEYYFTYVNFIVFEFYFNKDVI